jgi:hypothetical protein
MDPIPDATRKSGQIIDVLMRRRQNNLILTPARPASARPRSLRALRSGRGGRRSAALRGVNCASDIGLMQPGRR